MKTLSSIEKLVGSCIRNKVVATSVVIDVRDGVNKDLVWMMWCSISVPHIISTRMILISDLDRIEKIDKSIFFDHLFSMDSRAAEESYKEFSEIFRAFS